MVLKGMSPAMLDLLSLCSEQAGHGAAAAQAPASPTSAAMGDEGDHRGWSMLTSSEPPSLTSRAPGMLPNQNVSPVHPNLWEHYNSNKTHLGSFLPPSWHQLSSPFPGRLVRELGVPEYPGFQSLTTRSISKYILYSLGNATRSVTV